ncbi:MAG: AglZ/HisF2 family acetamidino modification protein [Hydrogenovibrio sp.]|uniref:AglZ/HisF2 family acetamidino modification protein n=1 Tax=Hydrogenovibrio sp. TaxID=2065821 RepID=UPI0028703F91|nr:AglZ/HisF2 family acetamidino modification protein [Hydrogenovibrio sp.]MDR9498528.1 AglZ/HisF2 family acetamidino modification protein [Hydrogenovibrio sp.]MDR9499242.1 AglZ/HisF2 family acetamidino modification protein [Hydrogenovibrio sp.]
MLRTRVIPVLLLQEGGLVKGQQFKNHKYVGDPINAVKIFNEKEVDELVFLDISATDENRGPDFYLLADMASEAFMPFAYGGGVKTVKQVERLFSIGVEKAIINTAAFLDPNMVKEAVKVAGSQSIVVSMDVKKPLFGSYEVYVNNGKAKTKLDPVTYAKKMQDYGVGELIVSSIDREGTGKGYDIKLLEMVSDAVAIPVVGLGGAGCVQDLADAKNQTAVSGLAAGDLFVFHGKHKAVLITYPKYSELEKLFN